MQKVKVECSEKESQLQVMKNEFDEKVSKLENATQDISGKMAALEDMKKQVAEKESKLKNIQEENSKTTAELENTKKALDVLSKKECEVYQAQVSVEFNKENAREDIEKQATRIKEMEAEIREKVVELNNTKSESAKKISELETELAERKEEMKTIQSEDALAELEQQLVQSTIALDKKNCQVIARNNTIKRLEISLAEKEKLLSEMEKLPKEPNLRAKEELKTLRRRLVQVDKEKEESKEMLAKKDGTLEETRLELEKIKKEHDEKSAKFLKELQQARTEIKEVKEETEKKDERILSLKEKLNSQQLKNACLQTQLENEKRSVLEKESAAEEAKKELGVVRSSSATELDEANKRLVTTEGKVQELEDEVFAANETTSRLQTEIQRYQNQVVPDLEKRVKSLEEEITHNSERIKVRKVNYSS